MARNKKFKTGKNKKQLSPQVTETTIASKSTEPGEKLPKKRSTPGSVIPGHWKINALVFLLLLIATAILYSGDLHLGFFTVDDPGYVTDNPWIKSFSATNLGHVLTVPYFANFSPVHLLSYMIDYSIAGPDAYVFHLSSNIWAGIVAGFVYLVGVALIRDRFIAIAASVLFVLHPAHVEAIAWISSRKDLVAAAFALPCLLTYMRYRKGGESAKWWYIATLVLFMFAVGGKLSVATFFGVFLVLDLFVEKRPLIKSLVDKLPFLLIAIIFAFAVASAQPSSGNRSDPFIYLASLGESLWLLTGFGSYVLNRIPVTAVSTGLEIIAFIVLAALFLLPFLFRRRIPLVAVLVYWILLTYLPSQVLSFVHPVTDRYLFMPSVATVILIAWGVVSLAKKIGQKKSITSSLVLFVIAVVWGFNTMNYLKEWQDPRSVWFGAVKKSKDPDVYYSLGAHYLNISGQLDTTTGSVHLSEAKKEALANKVWQNDQRLPQLIAEWRSGKQNGPVAIEFQKDLWQLAENEFKLSFNNQGSRAMPHLYFRLGVLYLNRGDYKRAKEKFLQAIDEVSRYTVIDVGHELTVASYSNLGLIATKEGNFKEALQWYKTGEEKQNEFGGNWVLDIAEQRKKMEATVGLQSGSTENTTDPNAAYNLGMYYLNSSNKLGAAQLSIDEEKRLANEVWKTDPQLSSLISEWDAGQHGGPAEKIFQAHLKDLAWNAFEKAVQSKGATINSNLYFRRGMLLGERGDMNGARKEFTAALSEAAKEPNDAVRKEVTIVSQDAIGILSWREKNYKDALQWFQKALQQQTSFGGNWVPDLATKCKQMESMIASGSK